MMQEQKIIENNLGLLKLAETLGHLGGMSPDQFDAAHKPGRRGMH